MYHYVDSLSELYLIIPDKHDVLEFRCDCCGKLSQKVSYKVFKDGLTCKSCMQKKSFFGKNWSERLKLSKETKLKKYGNANFTNADKRRKTNIEKYGTAVAANSNQIKDKIILHNKEKYGVPFYFQSNEAKDKLKSIFDSKTIEEKRKIKDKRKNTCLEKYGAPSLVESDYFKEKSNNTCLRYRKDFFQNHKTKTAEEIYESLGSFPFIKYEKLSLDNPYQIIQHYHESIWKANVNKKPSPFDAWNNKDLMIKVIKNRVVYNNPPYTANKFRQGLNVTKLAPKVSVFKPVLAKHIIEKYLSEFSTVFDPFSGFSGRMLGACACGKKYIGQDINETHVKESNEIIQMFNLDADVSCKDIFDSEGEYDCLFTCPPYGLKEQWNENETDKSCDEWIDECMKRFKCQRYVFVVDKTIKYKDNVVEEIVNKSHFSNNKEHIVVIGK